MAGSELGRGRLGFGRWDQFRPVSVLWDSEAVAMRWRCVGLNLNGFYRTLLGSTKGAVWACSSLSSFGQNPPAADGVLGFDLKTLVGAHGLLRNCFAEMAVIAWAIQQWAV